MGEVLDRPTTPAGPRAGARAAMPDCARRLRLCEAAAGVFLRDGYAAASMDEVARVAGMSKRTLYQVFPSKAALFEETIAATLVPIALDTDLEREPDLRRALTGILVAAAEHLLAERQIGIFRLVIGERHRSPELAAATHRVLTARGSSVLERRLATEAAAGCLALSNPGTAARMLYGMVLGSAQMRLLLGVRDPPRRAEIVALAEEAVGLFLDGAAPRGQQAQAAGRR
ncbi:TetR/AcrR family transcriptional regulator [Roseomonas sp. PWR1]|uniref:TetR/AcrR family transcriptional regulator n=1 Tax=Roseomonas nitratireducens TaxID=2820810 RepID=A0ABS4AQ39_9PROT|nr:TetR/AcrR family transcriptional regulator [Neoroseomonas nitratireducens]MBP0463480.1 TetR/AcrR family transcriptional regulator [Neoroseomonas nitratireducens]